MQASDDPVQRFGAIYAALEAELDWELLASTYCEGESSGFFDSALRERMLDTGLWIADQLANRLDRAGPRRSLYLGAAVAELAPILVEHLLLRREVIWLNLDGVETRELQRAIDAVAARERCSLPRPSSAQLESVERASCDHLWMVSVLSDPDHFPALHDELYARAGSKLATGRGVLAQDRARAELLSCCFLERAASECTLSTSEEELEFLQPLLQDLRLRVELSEPSRLSAIVGDRVRIGDLVREVPR